jgi:hypothetical protein
MRSLDRVGLDLAREIDRFFKTLKRIVGLPRDNCANPISRKVRASSLRIPS